MITWGKNVLHAREAGAVSESAALVAGQLGVGDVLSSLPVRALGLPEGDVITDVSAGLNHTVVAAQGIVYSCGSNAFMQLGRSGDPIVFGAISQLVAISSIACGDQHTIAVTEDGAVFAWGSNLRGQLGIGPQISKAPSPHRVFKLTATRVAAGAFHSLVCTPDGQCFAWGSNHYGQLGVGQTNGNLFRPHPVTLPLVELCDVSCGPDSSLAISADGVPFVWGMLMAEGGEHHQVRADKSFFAVFPDPSTSSVLSSSTGAAFWLQPVHQSSCDGQASYRACGRLILHAPPSRHHHVIAGALRHAHGASEARPLGYAATLQLHASTRAAVVERSE